MLDGNVLLRQKRDVVPEGTLSCPDRNLAVFHHYRHYEGLRLLPSVCDSKLIQQTLIIANLSLIYVYVVSISLNTLFKHSCETIRKCEHYGVNNLSYKDGTWY